MENTTITLTSPKALKLYKGFLYLRGIDVETAKQVVSHQVFENYDVLCIEDREDEIAINLQTLVKRENEHRFVSQILYPLVSIALQANNIEVKEDTIDIDNYVFKEGKWS